MIRIIYNDGLQTGGIEKIEFYHTAYIHIRCKDTAEFILQEMKEK